MPEKDPELLRKLCAFNGVMEFVFRGLDYPQKIALYAGTFKDVLPSVRTLMEKTLRNSGK